MPSKYQFLEKIFKKPRISQKSVLWEQHCLMWKDGRTWSWATSHNFLNAPSK